MKHLQIAVKRAYEPPDPSDGQRILVDRLWPRGLRKEGAQVDEWVKEVAPSADLRHWFGHEPDKRTEFQRRYAQELDGNTEAWHGILAAARKGKVTLLYSARDTDHNNALVLQQYLQQHAKRGGHGAAAAGAEH